jgi:segregation and condensation protein A
MSFSVKTETYEGPFDVLLDLIEKRKLLINDISLSKVADDFVQYVSSHTEFPLSQAAHFVLVASTLLLIKSKSLLPTLSFTEEEQSDVDDLKRRLELHALFRERAQDIEYHWQRTVLWAPAKDRPREPVFSPDPGMTVTSLFEAVQSAIANLPTLEDRLVEATVRKVVSLEEMIERLSKRIETASQMRFTEFASVGRVEKVEVIVGFLAMLELVKQGIIRVHQQAAFSDIVMEHDRVGMPRYG